MTFIRKSQSIEISIRGIIILRLKAQPSISNGKVAFNGKFFALGIPGDVRDPKKECRALCFLPFDRQSFIIKPIKWLNKHPFKNFYLDDHLTSIMMVD